MIEATLDLIEEVGTEVTFERDNENQEQLEDGFYVRKGTLITFTRLVSIQPRSGVDLEPEERSERERIEFDVFGLGEPLRIHDRFQHLGKLHEITNVQRWPGHFEAIAVEKET